MRERLSTLYRLLGPWVALGLGILTILFLRRGLHYAPVALVLVLAGWVAAALLHRLTSRIGAGASTRPTRRQRLLGGALRLAVAGTVQNVLFFLVPLWFASATWGSINMVVPILLGCMALFSCFERIYLRQVVARPRVRTAWHAVVLFAALDPALLALTGSSSRWHVAGAAAVAAGVCVVATWLPRPGRWLRSPLFGLAAAAVAGLAFLFLAPLLPPVPVMTVQASLGTGVEKRQLTGQARTFDAGTERVYGWFAVAAPRGFEQRIRFVWKRAGRIVGRPFETRVVGGRQSGFRTWSYVSRPWPGPWQVELVTETGQLVGRTGFTIYSTSRE